MNDTLENDQIKYVSYAIVFTKPKCEQVMPRGEGSLVLTESLNDIQFVAACIAKYVSDNQRKDDYNRLIQSPADARYLRVYFVNPAMWAREPSIRTTPV